MQVSSLSLNQNGSVHICVDLTHFNKAVQLEIHPMPSVNELGDSKIFPKLDTNSGFWQIPLDDKSKLPPIFVTPFGHFCFNRLPFGISSAPEIFQRTMSQILEGLEGTPCQMDMSSFTEWTSQNMMDTYERFFTAYKKLG